MTLGFLIVLAVDIANAKVGYCPHGIRNCEFLLPLDKEAEIEWLHLKIYRYE